MSQFVWCEMRKVSFYQVADSNKFSSSLLISNKHCIDWHWLGILKFHIKFHFAVANKNGISKAMDKIPRFSTANVYRAAYLLLSDCHRLSCCSFVALMV
jgi:hypothetical protein